MNDHKVSEFTATLVVGNKYGLHARPSMKFVEIAKTYECDVEIAKDGETVDGKSLMGLLSLAAEKGARIRITTRGLDAGDAFAALKNMIEGDCGEES